MTRAPLATVLAPTLVCALAAAALADQTYHVRGMDRFSIGGGDIRSEISYRGTEHLRVSRHGKATRFIAHVVYRRSDGDATTAATSDFTADVLPSGELVDSADHDPDYLTVLNQPFSAALDSGTIADLRRLRGALPFDFPSPFTGSSLHGFLRSLGIGKIGGRRSIGVRFESSGPMRGALPDRPGLTLDGSIAMRGMAYYDLGSSLMLVLDTTVTIAGNVSNRAGRDPVTIVYARSIRADTSPSPDVDKGP